MSDERLSKKWRGTLVFSDWAGVLGQNEVRLVESDAVLDEAGKLVRVLRSHDDAHVAEDIAAPLWDTPVAFQPKLLLQQPAAAGTQHTLQVACNLASCICMALHKNDAPFGIQLVTTHMSANSPANFFDTFQVNRQEQRETAPSADEN